RLITDISIPGAEVRESCQPRSCEGTCPNCIRISEPSTQNGRVAGTPQYVSPEQAQGEVVDYRSDLFSLGSVLYAMCTCRPPSRATGSMAVLERVREDTPRPIREVNPDIPAWLCEIIARLHAMTPAAPFSSAGEVADLLRQYLAHLQQPAM